MSTLKGMISSEGMITIGRGERLERDIRIVKSPTYSWRQLKIWLKPVMQAKVKVGENGIGEEGSITADT